MPVSPFSDENSLHLRRTRVEVARANATPQMVVEERKVHGPSPRGPAIRRVGFVPTISVPGSTVSSNPVILFDGVCNLCNGAVNFIIDRDPAARFRFASIQSRAGAELLRGAGISGADLDTLVLIEEGRVRVRSDAVLAVAARLRGPWSLLRLFRIIPAPLRDLVYRLVAKHRYRVFGRKSECMLPTAELRSRFLGDG